MLINDVHDHLHLHRHRHDVKKIHVLSLHACLPSFRASRGASGEIHVLSCACIPCGLHRSVPFLIRPSSCVHVQRDLILHDVLSYVCLHLHDDVRDDLRISMRI